MSKNESDVTVDYPMSSSLGAEKTPIGSRSKTVLLIFASYGAGSFAANIVFLVLVAAFKNSIEHDVHKIQWVWRLLLGIGIIPPAVTLYGRLTMRETEPYRKCKASSNSRLP
jgi:PHS family inorganic phosphate transporter-like MFS transporter